MKIEIEFVLRCSKCLNTLSAKKNYPGSTTLYSVEPCQKCIEELAQKLKGENDGNKDDKST